MSDVYQKVLQSWIQKPLRMQKWKTSYRVVTIIKNNTVKVKKIRNETRCPNKRHLQVMVFPCNKAVEGHRIWNQSSKRQITLCIFCM